MSLILSEGDSKSYAPAPTGNHPAVCVDLIDLGIVETPFLDEKTGRPKRQHKCILVYQINERNEDGERYLIFGYYTASLNEQANLRKLLESWRGKAFSREELKGFDVAKLVGIGCMLNVLHRESSNGRTYATIASIAPPMPGFQAWDYSDYVRPEKYQESDDDDAEPVEDPEWMKEEIPAGTDAEVIPF